MTIKELKSNKKYHYECNIDKKEILYEISNSDYFDEWGDVYISLGKEIGAEYNLCVDNTTNENLNCSAIYKVDYNKKNECFETDYNSYIHYEIDFNNPKWKVKLENAMCKALIKMFKL